MLEKMMNLQMFADANATTTVDLEPAVSIDFTSRLGGNIDKFREILGITDMIPMSTGTVIKAYKLAKENTPEQVGEGEVIPLTKITRKLAWSKELTLKKYRKATSAEAIQKVGYDKAINDTDEKLVKEIQKEIKADFFTSLESGTGTATGTNLQTACANLWGKLQERYEDSDVTPVYFINPLDVAEYLGTAQITTQNAFGLTYIENFLGMGNAIITKSIAAKTVYATVGENLNGAYVPNGGAIANAFGLTMDETGYVGMTHATASNTATLETLVMSGVMFFPEYVDGVFKATITA